LAPAGVSQRDLRERLERDPRDLAALLSLAKQLIQRREYEESERLLQRASRLQPKNPEILNNLEFVQEQLGELDDAVDCYRRAVRFRPSFHQGWANLANGLLNSGEPAEAEPAAREAIRLAPSFAPAHNALGAILIELGRHSDGLAALRRCIELAPAHPEAHANLGIGLLRTGEWRAGWKAYESRRDLPNPLFHRKTRPWDGSDPFGQTFLLYGEGGLGNQIHFCRYVPVMQKLGARVILECRPELVALFAKLAGAWKVISVGDQIPHHDFHCPLTSLPHRLGTTPQNAPANVPYLPVDANLVEQWKQVVRTVPGFRIGVCWRGDTHVRSLRGRSFDPKHLAVLADIPGVSVISLQYGPTPPRNVPIRILPGLEPNSMTLPDVTAVMQHLDLVICNDTSIAHLAGATARPVWTLLKFNACWRWMLKRSDTPWYPTMRLFRQGRAGEWEPVFEQVAYELGRLARRV
jgi:Flp pilus assembly protein TadD